MAARRGRGSTAVHVIFSQHAEILQYSRKTITGRFRATDRLDILYTARFAFYRHARMEVERGFWHKRIQTTTAIMEWDIPNLAV